MDAYTYAYYAGLVPPDNVLPLDDREKAGDRARSRVGVERLESD